MTGTKWWVQDVGDGTITLIASLTGMEGTGCYQFSLPTTGDSCILEYPKVTGFPAVPGGVSGGNGPFGIGDGFCMGWTNQVPAGDPTGAYTLRYLQILSTPDPTTSAPTPTGYFADPDVSSGGDGSIGNPWSVTHALTTSIPAGSTIWIRAGNVPGAILPTIDGASGNPIIVRSYPGEHVHFTGHMLTTDCTYTRFMFLEIAATNPASDGSIGAFVNSVGVEFVGCVVHDAGHTGIGAWDENSGGRYIDCIVYQNGTSTNLDHGFYVNSNSGTKLFDNCIVYNNLAYGFHLWSSQDIQNVTISRCASIDNGYGNPLGAADFFAGSADSSSRIVSLTLSDCLTWRADRSEISVELGRRNSQQHGTLTLAGKCRFLGVVNLHNADWTSIVQGPDVRTISASQSVPNEVFVFPSIVTPKYGHVHIYNGAEATDVDVDLSTILASGDAYNVYSAFDPFGSPVLSGTYAGGSVAFPMDAITSPTIINGGAEITPGPEFGSFIVKGPDTDSESAPPDFDDTRAPILEYGLDASTGEFVWKTRTDPDAHPSEDPDPTPTEHYRAAANFGTLTDWKIEAKLALDGTGSLSVYRGNEGEDYTQVVSYTGPLGYNATYPGWLRIGLEKAA